MQSVTGAAALSDGAGGFVIDQVEVRALRPVEVRVALRAAGVCHTDHASLGWPGPQVLGHEGAGVVEALGADVTHLRVGQPVLLNWAIPCGGCPQCRRGRGALCERTHGVDATLGSSAPAPGHTLWRGQAVERAFKLGTFAEFTLVRAEALTPLPEPMTSGLSMRCACILGCGVMTGVGAASRRRASAHASSRARAMSFPVPSGPLAWLPPGPTTPTMVRTTPADTSTARPGSWASRTRTSAAPAFRNWATCC
jgi:Zn-dependent alcohol dehydrogenase